MCVCMCVCVFLSSPDDNEREKGHTNSTIIFLGQLFNKKKTMFQRMFFLFLLH